MTNAKAPASDNHDGMDQDQFLTILSREDALARFEAALFPRPVLSERRPLAEALGCALSEDVVAPIDVRRSTVPMSTALRCVRPILLRLRKQLRCA